MNNDLNKQSHLGILQGIPKWMLPVSYIIIVSISALILYVLNLIPYDHSISNTTIIYNDGYGTGENDTAHGEILLSNIAGISTGDFVDFTGMSSNGSQISHKGCITDIYYDGIRNTYVVKIEVTQSHKANPIDYPMRGVATIVYETDTLLGYLINHCKQLF